MSLFLTLNMDMLIGVEFVLSMSNLLKLEADLGLLQHPRWSAL